MNILQKVTWKVLMRNKTRTWVTVIGILLSAAMFTAVTTCVSSVQHFLLRTVIAAEGSWHGVQYNVSAEQLNALRENEEVKSLAVWEKVGYALIGSTNEYKPYLMVQGIDANTDELLPLRLTSGKMPENSGEILIPNHLYTNGEVELSVGSSLTLTLGERLIENWTMDQQNPFQEEEIFLAKETRTYTVVGFYDRLSYSIEGFNAPGYTALTVSDTAEPVLSDVYIQMKNPRDIYALLEASANSNSLNTDFLRYTGMSNEGSYNQVLYGLAAILIGIIVFGSVSLIYNAFSISVSERTKQFGILKTIGATKRQIRSSVYFEALILSAIGIPLGVLSGILGIAVTLYFTGGMFDALLGNDGVRLELYVSFGSVAIAAAIALITVLISAQIPAQRAMKQNAIDAVRQSADIQIKAQKVRSFRWVYKLFKFEGLLADKNFKRNRKKYRTTVLSLFVSVVLFVSASSFCAYLTDAAGSVVDVGDYDLSYYYFPERTDLTPEEFNAGIEGLKEVTEYTYFVQRYMNLSIDGEKLEEEYRSRREVQLQAQQASDRIESYLYFFDDAKFRAWAKGQDIDPEVYFDPENIQAIALNRNVYWDGAEEQYVTEKILKEEGTVSYSFTYIPSTMGGYTYVDSVTKENGSVVYIYQNDAGEQISYDQENPVFYHSGTVTAFAEESPLGGRNDGLQLIFPLSMKEAVLGDGIADSLEYQFKAANHRAAEQELEDLLTTLRLEDDYLSNLRAGNESDRALVIVVNVFSYGFIILISLIALANVFNTISTNIALRRREFAMLRSVGMTEKGLHRMMNYECILYGVRGLSSGLTAAVIVTFLIYQTVNAGYGTEFYIPWYSITVAVLAVFVVVFSTMLYSMKKIRGEDPIAALKNENL